jgi:hypothetical protein
MPERADSESDGFLIKETWEPNCLQRRFGFKWRPGAFNHPAAAQILRLIFQTATAQIWEGSQACCGVALVLLLAGARKGRASLLGSKISGRTSAEQTRAACYHFATEIQNRVSESGWTSPPASVGITIEIGTTSEKNIKGVIAATEFQDRCLKPLGHPSVTLVQYR